MNVAFDANIWISFSIGKHLGILRHILLDESLQQTMQIHGCAEIVAEYQTVVGRPKLKKYVKPERVQETLELIARITTEHVITKVVSGSRDPKDNYLLALAEIVPLDYLVTGDHDLLVLERWQQTQIITFTTFVDLVGRPDV